MNARSLQPRRLDVQRFAADSGALSGHWPLSEFQRLVEAAAPERPPSAEDRVTWKAQGEQIAAVEPEIWLHVAARTALAVPCQRCLTPVSIDLVVDRRIRFVQGEAAAEKLDAESEDDVLAVTRSLDLHALIEDELLLALPLVPMHADCPQLISVARDDPPAEAAAHPFAVLAGMKTSRTSGGS